MSANPAFINAWRTEGQSIVAGHTTMPVRLWVPGPGGSRIHAISIGSSDNAANNVDFSIGKALTTQERMGVGTFVDNGASADTFTRTVGSFITDGFKVGDRLAFAGATTLLNNFSVVLTTVVALTLTFATATVAAGEVLPAGGVAYKLLRGWSIAVPLGSGASAVAGVDGMSPIQAPQIDATPNRYLMLGPTSVVNDANNLSVNTALFGTVTTTMGAGESMDITLHGGDY